MAGSGPLVDAAWLAANAGAVVIADVRWYLDGRSGREAYDRGHIVGARFVDLDTDLSGPPTTEGGRHPLPAPEDFAASMGRLGIGDDAAVVAYDDVGGVIASRLWWMLDCLGCETAVLDGGLDAWPGALQTVAPSWQPETFTARPWPADRLATIDEVDAARTDPESVVIDARSVERIPGRAQRHRSPLRPHPRRGQHAGRRQPPRRPAAVSGRDARPLRAGRSGRPRRSSPTAAAACPPVTTCSPSVMPDWATAGCSWGRGRLGEAIPTARWPPPDATSAAHTANWQPTTPKTALSAANSRTTPPEQQPTTRTGSPQRPKGHSPLPIPAPPRPGSSPQRELAAHNAQNGTLRCQFPHHPARLRRCGRPA